MNTPSLITIQASCDIEAAAKDQPRRFRIDPAYTGTALRVSGFDLPIVVDLSGMSVDEDIVANLDHAPEKRVGHCTYHENDGRRLLLSGIVSVASAAAEEFVNSPDFPWKASIEAIPQKIEEVKRGASATANGRSFDGPIFIARKSNLIGIAILSKGADPQARAMLATKGSTMPTDIETDPILAERQAERQRLKTIDAICANDEALHSLRAKCIDGEISLDALRDEALHSLRAGRSTVRTSLHSHADVSDSRVLEAALAMHVGLRGLSTQYDERVLHAASRAGITCLMDVAKQLAVSSGRAFDSRSKDSVLKAAFSTVGFTDLLTGVANQSLLEAYRAFPSAARLIAGKLTANDFKEHTGLRLTGDVVFEEVAADGEIKHGTLGDQSFPFRLKTVARMLGLTRQDIINDSLSALDSIPRMLGRGGALALEETFWALVIANTANFFHANNGNLLTGGASALSATSLASAVQKFLEQTDTEGKPVSAIPIYLVVPPALKAVADELFVSRTLNVGGGSTTTDNKLAGENALFGKYQPLVSPWIGANGLPGGSDTAWYLFSDPRDIAAFGIAYLDNRDTPVIEQSEQEFNKLGIQWRGYFDIGVCQVDHRGAVKSDGA